MSAAADVPDGFLWGAATAAHQVEGANVGNDWWAWEHRDDTNVAEPSGDAIDHLHRFGEDLALLASLGHNAHRFSLEWSRIEPAPGAFSTAALDHYARVLHAVLEHGMTPVVTLEHFTLPRWLAERGSWLAPDAVARFGAYAERVATTLGDLIPWACTLNEPQVAALQGYLFGDRPPGLRDLGAARAAGRAQLAAHGEALAALVAAGVARSGLCVALPWYEPARPGDERCEQATALLRAEAHDLYLDGLDGDFVGLQYYHRAWVDPDRPGWMTFARPGERTTLMGWEWYPEGFRLALERVARTGLPIVVTENGIATADDTERIAFLEQHLAVLREAIAAGVDVRGYLHWTAFDNFEWLEGFRATFGLVGIDRADGLRRVVRPSAVAFGRVCRSGRVAALRERD